MSLFRTLFLSLCAAAAVATPALALDRPRDQDRAFRATQEGRAMPLPQIERRVLPQMRGADYLGPEFRGPNDLRMKFMEQGKVIWVDVDPKTGRIKGRSGN